MARIRITLIDASGDVQSGLLVRLYNATGSSPSWGWGTSVGDFTEIGSTGEYYYDITVSGHYGIKAGEDAESLAALTATLGMRINAEDMDTTYVLTPNSVPGNIPIFDVDGQIEDSECAFRTSAETSFANSDSEIPTDKFLKTLLASTSNGKGASLIGIEDSAGNTAQTDVEAAIAEIYGLFGSQILDISSTVLTLAISVTYKHAKLLCTKVVDGNGDPVLGQYSFQYVYKNDTVVDPPNDISWGVETTDISQAGNLLEITIPEPGDVLYSGGDEGYCYLYARVKFENLVSETALSYDNEAVAEPDDPSDAGIVEELADGGENARAVLRAIVGMISEDSAVGRMMLAARDDFKQGAGTPTTTSTVPDYVGQWYFDTTNEDWYRAVDTVNVADFKKLS